MITVFKEVWYEMDPDSRACIPVDKFPQLFKAVAPVFGLPVAEEEMNFLLRKMEVDENDELRFSDVLYVIAFETFGAPLGSSHLAMKLEQKKVRQERKLDGALHAVGFKENKDNVKVMPIPRITEQALMEMNKEQLLEELRLRGAIRAAKQKGLSLK